MTDERHVRLNIEGDVVTGIEPKTEDIVSQWKKLEAPACEALDKLVKTHPAEVKALTAYILFLATGIDSLMKIKEQLKKQLHDQKGPRIISP